MNGISSKTNSTPTVNGCRKVIFSLGKRDVFGQRGYFEEPYSSDSYRGSFVAGITFLDKTRVGWWKNGFPPYYTRIPKAADWSRINLRLIDEEARFGRLGCRQLQPPPRHERGYLLPGHGGDLSPGKPAPHPYRAHHGYGKTQPLSHQVQCVLHQLYR